VSSDICIEITVEVMLVDNPSNTAELPELTDDDIATGPKPLTETFRDDIDADSETLTEPGGGDNNVASEPLVTGPVGVVV